MKKIMLFALILSFAVSIFALSASAAPASGRPAPEGSALLTGTLQKGAWDGNPANAFDGDVNTLWSPSNVAVVTGYTFEKKMILSEIRIKPDPEHLDALYGLYIIGSNDENLAPSNQVPLFVGEDDFNDDEWYTITAADLQNNVGYTNIVVCNVSPAVLISLAEIEFYGYEAGSGDTTGNVPPPPPIDPITTEDDTNKDTWNADTADLNTTESDEGTNDRQTTPEASSDDSATTDAKDTTASSSKPSEESKGNNWWIWAVIAVVVIAGGATAVVITKKKK